jgi:hypothetical protein
MNYNMNNSMNSVMNFLMNYVMNDIINYIMNYIMNIKQLILSLFYILARCANFVRSLRVSPCHEVSVLANIAGRDVRSTTGNNLKLLEELTGLNP